MKSFAVLVVLLVAVAGYAALGSFQIEPDEEAVVLLLGRHVRTVGPGLHFHAPPLEKMEKRRTNLQREEFGFRTLRAEPQQYEEHPEERRMFTGDQNIVEVEFIVQHRIVDLASYLFRARRVEEILRDIAQSAMREAVASRPIDAVLREQRSQIAAEAKLRIQELSDEYELGLDIETVELQEVNVPDAVQAAFRDVASAQQDRERLILEAQGYADQIVPEARGEAEAMVNEAQAYRDSLLLEAQGEANRFSALVVEYQKAPEVTRERLYIETLEQILPGMEKIIIEEGHAERVLPYLPLGPRGVVR